MQTPLEGCLFYEHHDWFNLGVQYRNYGRAGMIFAEGKWITPPNLPVIDIFASDCTVIVEILEEGHLANYGCLVKESFDIIGKTARACLYRYANQVGHHLPACHKKIAEGYGVTLREPEFLLYKARLGCYGLQYSDEGVTDDAVLFDSAISRTHEVIAHQLFPGRLYRTRGNMKGWESYDRIPQLKIIGVFFGSVITEPEVNPKWADEVYVHYSLEWLEQGYLKKSLHSQSLKMIVFTDPNQAQDEGLCCVPIVLNAQDPPSIEELGKMFFEVYFDPEKNPDGDSFDTRSQNYMQYCMMSAIRTLYTGREKTARLAEYLIQTNVIPYLYAEDKEDFVADLMAAPSIGDRTVSVRLDPSQ